MAWYEIVILVFSFLGLFVFLITVINEYVKTNKAYRDALSYIEKIHFDLVELVKVMRDIEVIDREATDFLIK